MIHLFNAYPSGIRAILAMILFSFALGASSQNSLLWKVTGKKKSKVSYLYGTFHTSDERAFFLMDTLEHFLTQCDVFAGEVDLDDMNSKPAEMMKFVLMEDTTLKDLYTPEEFGIVRDSLMKKMGVGSMMMMKVKPFFIMPMLTLGDDESLNDLTEGVIIDDYLQNMASDIELEISALETIEEAIGAIDAISLSEQAEMLLEALQNQDMENDMEEIVEAYLMQDLNRMLQILEEEEMNANMEKSIVNNRNQYFSERLMRMMKKKKVFCAVGALHLPGETGLINSLRQNGYTVEAVMLNQ